MTAIGCKIGKIMLILFTTGVSEIIPGVLRHSFFVILTLHILDFWFLNAHSFCFRFLDIHMLILLDFVVN